MSALEHSPQSNARTAVGRPFAPGQSGNPAGRAKGLERRVRELIGDDGHKAADYMLEVLEDKTAPRRDRMTAAAWLADRGFGKATGPGHDGSPARYPMLDLSKLTNEQLDAYIELVETAAPDLHPVIDQR